MAYLALEDFLSAFRTPLRARIPFLIARDDLSLYDVVARYESRFGRVRRETVYRALEHLCSRGILLKEYDKRKKRLLYSLSARKIEIDFVSNRITTKED